MIEIVPSKASLSTSAPLIPSLRALACWCSGSLFVRMEMKIRLSMPSTISSTTRVANAAQASGFETNAKCGARNSSTAIGFRSPCLQRKGPRTRTVRAKERQCGLLRRTSSTGRSAPEGRHGLFESGADPEGGDPVGKACAVGNLDGYATDGSRAVCGLEAALRYFVQKPVKRLFPIHPDRGVVVAAHAYIRDVGRPAGQNLMVGGRLMRVRAGYESDSSVHEVAETSL